MEKTAIFVDGAFFIKRALHVFGEQEPDRLAALLWRHCLYHIYPERRSREEQTEEQKRSDFQYALEHLYRIFFYDCPPPQKKMHHPVTGKCIDFARSDRALWRLAFHEALREKRKVALRMGTLDEANCAWTISPAKIKELYTHKTSIDDLKEEDYKLTARQKGVDMRIGIDIASVSYKKQASRIILIAGDSDFVPAAKLARREGIDFILDSMHAPIKHDLHEHIDGKHTVFPTPRKAVMQESGNENDVTAPLNDNDASE